MIRSDAEAKSEVFRYDAASGGGTARILDAPPNLRKKKG
jgi:hypothetical protein